MIISINNNDYWVSSIEDIQNLIQEELNNDDLNKYLDTYLTKSKKRIKELEEISQQELDICYTEIEQITNDIIEIKSSLPLIKEELAKVRTNKRTILQKINQIEKIITYHQQK